MSHFCERDGKNTFDGESKSYKTVLLIVTLINLSMFFVEMVGGMNAGSMSLQADSLDFLGDSLTYLISFLVIGMSVKTRAKASLFKGISLLLIAVWVAAGTLYRLFFLNTPEAYTMGSIATAALLANLISALLLYKFRTGDSNVTSVWLCSRNDAIGNIAVLLAAAGIFASGSPWPDLIVAAVMTGLFMHSASIIIGQSKAELRAASVRTSGSNHSAM